MEISNILGKLHSKEVVPKKFLALEITNDLVQSAVWHVIAGHTEVVALGTPIPWNGDDENGEELVAAVDGTLSKAIVGLIEEPNEVIFGLPSSWSENDAIRPEKRHLIKKVCTDLALKPLGFVVVMSSLIQYLKMQEGTPTTAIFVQVADTELTIALVSLGKILALKSVGRSDDVAADVEEGISRCLSPNIDNLPSRIIIFDGMHDLEEVTQNLLAIDWPKKFPFLHIPKIENLPKDIVIRAIAVAGGSEVAAAIGFVITVPTSPSPQSELLEDGPTKAVDPETTPTPIVTDDHGNSPVPLTPEKFGFHSVASTPLPPPKVSSPPSQAPLSTPPSVGNPELDKSRFKLPALAPTSFHLPQISLSTLRLPLLIAIILVLLLGALASFIWIFPKAIITLTLTPKEETRSLSVTLDPELGSFDESILSLPAKTVTTEEKGEKTIATTGTKQIGDPALGEVTLYNRTALQKTFAKGTILTSGSHKFTLDQEIVVPGKSQGEGYIDVPGKVTGKITAQKIGESENLIAGSEFLIGSFSKDNYVGKNDAPLHGGSSREVRVVSKEDHAKLLDSLTDELEQKGATKLSASDTPTRLLPKLTKITAEDYSAKISEEAEEVTLSLSLTMQGLSYNQLELETLTKSSIAKSLPDNFSLEKTTVQIDEATTGSIMLVHVTLSLLPKFDLSSYQTKLVGRAGDSSTLATVFSDIPGFASATSIITPSWLPSRFKILPRKSDNISIVVQSTTD